MYWASATTVAGRRPSTEELMKPNILVALLGLAIISTIAMTNEATPSQLGSGKTEASGARATQADTSSTGYFRPGAGTFIVAEISKPLDAGKLKVGDTVECVLFQDLLYKGKIVVPRKSKALGHLTEVVRSSKGHPESHLGLVFDKLVLPGKKELPFQYPAIIAALAAPIRGTTVQTTKITDMPVQMERGRDTGGAMIDAVTSNSQLAGANMPFSTGAISASDRGVIAIRDVALDNSNSGYSRIFSKKGNLRLGFDVQILLQVTAPPKP
jgi:hypothetical protein